MDLPLPAAVALPTMQTFHLFYRDTGLYSGASITCMSDAAEAMAGPERVAIAGLVQPHGVRWVDGEIVEHRGPQPSPDHEWNGKLARWWLKPDVEAKKAAKAAAQDQIDTLEKQQARAIREERLGRGGTPAQLSKRLEDIDDQIITLRAIINS